MGLISAYNAARLAALGSQDTINDALTALADQTGLGLSQQQIDSLLNAEDVDAAIAAVVAELAPADEVATTNAIRSQLDAIAAAQALQTAASNAYEAAAKQDQDVRDALDEHLDRMDR